jgi:hypothetical protein
MREAVLCFVSQVPLTQVVLLFCIMMAVADLSGAGLCFLPSRRAAYKRRVSEYRLPLNDYQLTQTESTSRDGSDVCWSAKLKNEIPSKLQGQPFLQKASLSFSFATCACAWSGPFNINPNASHGHCFVVRDRSDLRVHPASRHRAIVPDRTGADPDDRIGAPKKVGTSSRQ